MVLDQIVNLVIRPPRASYSTEIDLLGPIINIQGRQFRRHDLQLVNKRGHFLECSHYRPVSEGPCPEDEALPCVIYCHGNSGCRADANDAVAVLLPLNITVLALDFSGSGSSQGEHVSLGKFEVEDLEAAVDYLRAEGLAKKIGLWGRSMGAVTALMYAAKDPSIAGIVADSPFSNLSNLILELVDYYKIPLPKFSVKIGVLPLMRRSIRQKAGFDINDLDLLTTAPSTFIPALFAHAKGDNFVQPHHSKDICDVYGGDKNRITFGGDHNSPRPEFFFDSVSIFLHNVLEPPPVRRRVRSLNTHMKDLSPNLQKREPVKLQPLSDVKTNGSTSSPYTSTNGKGRAEPTEAVDRPQTSAPMDPQNREAISMEDLARALSNCAVATEGVGGSDDTDEALDGEDDEALARAIALSMEGTSRDAIK